MMIIEPKHKRIAAWVLTLLCACTSFAMPLYSGDIDNYVMALVANKSFVGEAQDGYICYLHPFLCWLMEKLHFLLPNADVFTLTANIMLFIAIWFVGYAFANMTSNFYELIGCYSLLYISILMKDLFHYNFTRWGAFFGAAGTLLLMLAIHQKNDLNKWLVGASMLFSFGMMWRFETVLIFVPYILLDIIIKVLFEIKNKKERKEKLIRYWKIVATPVLCILLLFVSNQFVRNTDIYREAIAYDNARSAVVDYPMEEWGKVRKSLPGVSENDYESVRNWILMDTERIDTQFLLDMEEAGRKRTSNFCQENILKMQKAMLSVFWDSDMLMFMAVILALLGVLAIASDMSWLYKMEILFLYIGTDLIFIFFTYLGRAIERVYIIAVYALLVSVGTLYLCESARKEKWTVKVMQIGLAGLACLGIINEMIYVDFSLNQSLFNANRGIGNKYEEVCKGDELYIWRIGDYVNGPVRWYIQQGKLLPAEFVSHHLYDGAWTYGQVYFNEYLANINAANPMEALLIRENTYYVADDYGYVLTYLQENFDADTIVLQTGELDGIPVWKFEIEEDGAE